MDKSKLKARPTEYRKTVYKSKSEAMFARYLELVCEEFESLSASPLTPFFVTGCYGANHQGFMYEPQCLNVAGWLPDFLVWTVECQHGLPHLNYEVIEYKPSRPTVTYVDEFAARCAAIATEFTRQGIPLHAVWKLYFGNIWTQERGIYEVGVGRSQVEVCITDIDEDWLVDYVDAIKETRFDLES